MFKIQIIKFLDQKRLLSSVCYADDNNFKSDGFLYIFGSFILSVYA